VKTCCLLANASSEIINHCIILAVRAVYPAQFSSHGRGEGGRFLGVIKGVCSRGAGNIRSNFRSICSKFLIFFNLIFLRLLENLIVNLIHLVLVCVKLHNNAYYTKTTSVICKQTYYYKC